jgi:peptidoglycan hydrolase-like protein with peptidoglycan-binding domain
MRISRTAVAAVTVLATSGLVPLVTASPAAAVKQCVLGLYYDNNYVPGDTDLSPSCVMGQGAVSNAVSNLQHSLNDCYRKGLTVDRIFGPRTRTALVEVQRSLGIAADGVYGPQTARAMRHTIVSGGGRCDRISF